MRKVECTEWEHHGRERKVKAVVTGRFHQWASGYEEFESGPGNYTVGLVEMDGGTIKEFMPTDIKFIE